MVVPPVAGLATTHTFLLFTFVQSSRAELPLTAAVALTVVHDAPALGFTAASALRALKPMAALMTLTAIRIFTEWERTMGVTRSPEW